MSQPNANDYESKTYVQEVTERFTNETIANISMATNTSEVEHSENVNISTGGGGKVTLQVEESPDEGFHYLERLKDLQDEGVEGNNLAGIDVILTAECNFSNFF